MATDVILPALGMAQDSGTIVQWLKSEGDQVVQGEPIAEIQTDKVTVELESPATGTLMHISASAGDEVPVGQVIARILAPSDADAPQPGLPAGSEARAGVGLRAAENVHGTDDAVVARSEKHPAIAAVAGSGKLLASPKARRLASERGIDLALLGGSGADGVVLAADVLAAAMVPTPAQQPDAHLGRVWRLMSERTTQSWTTIPHFYLQREVVADSLISWRDQLQKQASEKLTYTDLLVKIIALALRRHPRLNAAWIEGAVVSNQAVNVGIAVATSDGLLVPVISHADELTPGAIAVRRKDLVERAQSGRLRPEDLQGGTFTISNLGMYGIDAFTAIINAPQVAILAVGTLAPRVVPVNGLPAVVPTMVLSLSCDHRVVDGARGAEFLATIAGMIAEPPMTPVE